MSVTSTCPGATQMRSLSVIAGFGGNMQFMD